MLRPLLNMSLIFLMPMVMSACGAPQRMPGPVDVCIRSDTGLQHGVATPSRAGVYDPKAPIVPEHLNWTVPGVGCVEYPNPNGAVGGCGNGVKAVVVAKALCQQ
jgi:hypothetical protein